MKLIRSAKIVVIDADGDVLLLRRSDTHPKEPHMPDIPGGVVEKGESMEEGVVRELGEETGLILDASKVSLLHSKTYGLPGISISRLLYAVRLTEQKPDIVLSLEHDKYDWVKPDELLGLEKAYQAGINYAHEHSLWDVL